MALFTLLREHRPEDGKVFCAVPFGVKKLSDGTVCNFDEVYQHVIEPTISACGLTAVRADGIYGPQGVLEAVWRGIQQAEVVLVDVTTQSPNVAAELVLALVLGKRIVVITQDPDDIPTDVRGLYRYIAYSKDFVAVDRLKTELAHQLAAIRNEPTTEMLLAPMPGGGLQPVPTRVVAVEREFVVVQSDDGRIGVLSNGDVEYSRVVKDMSRRFSVGDRVSGAFEIDPKGDVKYTLLAGQQNPWPVVVAEHPVGSSCTATVTNVVESVGVFVDLGHGVTGLVPVATVRGEVPPVGAVVDVSVVRVDVDQRRVTLRLDVVRSVVARAEGVPPVGSRTYGEVVRVVPENGRSGGFMLLRVAGVEGCALLHFTKMSAELRDDMNNGVVEVGEEVYVEVVKTDPVSGKVWLREVPEPEEESVAVTPAEPASAA